MAQPRPPFRNPAALSRPLPRWLPGSIAAALALAAIANGFERPTAEVVREALGSLETEPPHLRRLLTPSADFAPIDLPGPSDWLTTHAESGQTFAAYLASDAIARYAALAEFYRRNRWPVENLWVERQLAKGRQL